MAVTGTTRLRKQRIAEATEALTALGFPGQQRNIRSALTLLSLLGLKPGDAWERAGNPLMGITPMMEFFAEHYGKQYAPNTRETVRRQTVHQFVQAALVLLNPDSPSRPTNSPNAVYQIEANALRLLRKFGKRGWSRALKRYMASVPTLRDRYARKRDMQRIPVTVKPGRRLSLSAGGHNRLTKSIIEEFCPRFTPGGQVLYVGDTQKKWAFFDRKGLLALKVAITEHGKMPDVVVYHVQKKWLVLIEAVTSHGPVNPKRHEELKALFAGPKAGLVYVTAFEDARTMSRYAADISWETEVWIAEFPTHLIHFNGERFLGPH